MLANVHATHRRLSRGSARTILKSCFTQEVPSERAIPQSRLFSGLEAAEFASILYGCRPTATSLALFFRDSDSTLQCYVQDGQTGSESIYFVCNEVAKRLKQSVKGFRLYSVEILDDAGKSAGVFGELRTLSAVIREKLIRREVKLSNLLIPVDLIAAVVSSVLEAWLDTRRGSTIRWYVR